MTSEAPLESARERHTPRCLALYARSSGAVWKGMGAQVVPDVLDDTRVPPFFFGCQLGVTSWSGVGRPHGRNSGAGPLCDTRAPSTEHGIPWTEMDAVIEQRRPKNPPLHVDSTKPRSRSKPALRQALGREPGRDSLPDHPECECDGFEDGSGVQRRGCQLSSREENTQSKICIVKTQHR